MANLHLVRAIYGPKPTTPTVNTEPATPMSSPSPMKPTMVSRPHETRDSPIKEEICHGEAAVSSGQSATVGLSSAFTTTSTLSVLSFVTQQKTNQVKSDLSDVKPQKPIENSTQGQGFQAQGIHVARLQLIESSDAVEEEVKEEVKWNPTGSNAFSVSQSEPKVATPPVPCPLPPATISTPVKSLRELSPSPSATISTTFSAVPLIPSLKPTVWPPKKQAQLKYPPMRYLPPSGDYYEQTKLQDNFGDGFFSKEKCCHCWTSKCSLKIMTQCKLPCGVCGKKNHQGKGCSMLYCSVSWHRARGSLPEDMQLRPTPDEVKLLSRIGLIHPVTDGLSSIVPIMSHPVARTFYRDRPRPEALGTVSISTTQPSLPTMQSQRRTCPEPSDQSLSTAGNLINAALDPRLRNRNTDNKIEAADVSMDDPMQGRSSHALQPFKSTQLRDRMLDSPQNMELDTGPDFTGLNFASNLETRIQELEDQVLDLQRAMIAKDREIRKLKTVNETFKLVCAPVEGREHGAGFKRLRV